MQYANKVEVNNCFSKFLKFMKTISAVTVTKFIFQKVEFLKRIEICEFINQENLRMDVVVSTDHIVERPLLLITPFKEAILCELLQKG